MKLPRRTFLHLAAGAAALPTVERKCMDGRPRLPPRLMTQSGNKAGRNSALQHALI